MKQFALVLRSLTKSWIFSSTVIVLLACGIGITCAVFDLVYSVILRPFPYPEQERLVQIWETSRTREKGPVSLPDYEDMRRNQRTLEDAALMQNNSANVVWNGSPIPVPVHYFKAALFNVLKLNPILGRTFSEQEEHESKPVALVSEQFWKKRLDSRSDAVGQQLQIDARTFTIVGILPNTIKELWPGDIFMPMSFNPRLGLYLENREAYGFWSIGRLRPGVTIARANADLGAISSELARRFPKTNSDIKFEVVPLSDRFHRLYDGTMWLLGGASLCMLGIVYASVSNVMVARVLGRSSEFALKMSLGATKLQVFRELLLESVVLVLAATFIGLVINYLLVGSLQHLGPPDVFRFHSVGAGGVPIVVAAAAALASSIAISLLPFLTLQSSTLSTRLRGGDQRGSLRQPGASPERCSRHHPANCTGDRASDERRYRCENCPPLARRAFRTESKTSPGIFCCLALRSIRHTRKMQGL
jgi:putative ABC transport system permease protein